MSNAFGPVGSTTPNPTSAQWREAIKALTLTNNNTTASQTVFTVTGTVEIDSLWGEITTATGMVNHTGGFWRINDQTATVNITASGVTLSGLANGTIFRKMGLAAAAATLADNVAGTVKEPTALETMIDSSFQVQKKTGAVTTIDYRYATTDTPTAGVITFHAIWRPISSDGNLT